MMYRDGTNICFFSLVLPLKYVCVHACVCAHVCMCVYLCYAHVCTCEVYVCSGIWRPEFSIWCLFLSLSTLFSRNSLTLNLMLPCLARLEAPGILLSLIHQYWGHRHLHI